MKGPWNELIESFAIPGLPKAGIDGYVEWAKPHIKVFLPSQLRETESAKVTMTLR